MGVDIYGKNPILRGTKPEQIDWETASEEEKDIYLKEHEIWEEENPGNYFRANWWSWRPIHYLIEKVNWEKNLGIDTGLFGENSGGGPDDQESCDRLADALQEVLDNEKNLKEKQDRIYLNMGSWTDLDGRFITSEIAEKYSDELPKPGSITYSPFVASDGSIICSSHSVSRNHIQSFINFLRECGGFEIY